MSVSVIVQRVSSGSLLIDNKVHYEGISRGVAVFVGLIGDVKVEQIKKAASKICNAKIADGELASSRILREDGSFDLTVSDMLLIPQYTLSGTMKGRNTQYHQQCPKESAASLFQLFGEEVKQSSRFNKVVVGTFGNRQALQLTSDGPMTHQFTF